MCTGRLMIEVKESNVIEIIFTDTIMSALKADRLNTEIKQAIASIGGTKDIELDFRNVEAMDSAVIAALIRFVRDPALTDRKIVVKNLSTYLSQTFQLMRLSSIFTIKDGEE